MKDSNKLAKRFYEKLKDGEFEDGVIKKELGCLVEVGKAKQLEYGKVYWRRIYVNFIDIRTSLKAPLSNSLFHLHANKFYEHFLKQNPNTKDEDKLQFSNQLIKGLEQEYGVSLRKLNKHLSISKEDFVAMVKDYLKNI